MAWSPADIPDQSGRTFIITGGNSGIGFHAALELVKKGAHVIIGCRRMDAATAAAAKIDKAGPGSCVAAHLDLADLDSVNAFAKGAPKAIDVLVNNAGIMMTPRRITPQGWESQWGVNVVGHAALTKALLPRIKDRVVTISSIAHWDGRIRPATWHGDDYNPWKAYAQSKLGDLMFALRLQNELEAEGSSIRSVAAHPGVSLTRLAKDMPFGLKLTMILWVPFLQSANKGAWPTLRAATDDVAGGSYWGPAGRKERRGPPVEAEIKPHAKDHAMQDEVWNAVWG